MNINCAGGTGRPSSQECSHPAESITIPVHELQESSLTLGSQSPSTFAGPRNDGKDDECIDFITFNLESVGFARPLFSEQIQKANWVFKSHVF